MYDITKVYSEKQCRACKEVKNLSEFHINTALRDGLQIYCKVCKRLSELGKREVNKKIVYSYLKSVDKLNCKSCGITEEDESFWTSILKLYEPNGKAYRFRKCTKLKLDKIKDLQLLCLNCHTLNKEIK